MHEILTEWRAALDTSRPALRRFGLAVGAVALGLAALALWRHGGAWTPLATGLAAVGAALVGLGAALPAALRPVYRGWMLLAVALGFVMTRVLLTAVFFGLVTPLGLVRRALGHDPMRRRGPSPGTMWLRRDPPDVSPREAMERTF